MATWKPEDPQKYPAPRPDRPSDPRLLDAPEFSDDGEGMELDLMRRSYVNLSYECGDLEAIVSHIRTSNAPFTLHDLARLDKATKLMRAGLKAMRKVVNYERKWSISGTLLDE